MSGWPSGLRRQTQEQSYPVAGVECSGPRMWARELLYIGQLKLETKVTKNGFRKQTGQRGERDPNTGKENKFLSNASESRSNQKSFWQTD
ncbi:hypothetical protein NPIL_139291 [Nephila pilipes]|uniref:Uncharacterized protein n=1 Tax=Nephila pilipes TaxID=299642 RepID=A0A8X6PPK4_NEPPI|nr:hypothetical protein NPIL_139291 [Nephila pilipes]